MSIICPLFSGSTGNSTYIADKNTKILVDAGESLKGITQSLSLLDEKVEDICAIAVTHEHSDHIKGLKAFLKKSGAMLIASTKTLERLTALDKIPENTKIIALDSGSYAIGDINIIRFETSHDCIGSSGYCFNLTANKKISVCTDLGIVTDTVRSFLDKSDVVLLESNHDLNMLKKGPYPPQLKIRIMSDKGHISNNVCATEIKRLLNGGTYRFILGHLSQNNNTPLLARSATESALMDLGAVCDKDYLLKVAAIKNNGVVSI